MAFQNDYPRHRLSHGDEVIHSFGGNVLCYGRLMKPFMLKAFTKELEDITWEQRAISVPHNGDTEHVAAAQSLLSRRNGHSCLPH